MSQRIPRQQLSTSERSAADVPRRVGYSVLLMHRRKDLWGPDAHIWRPERWLEEQSLRLVKEAALPAVGGCVLFVKGDGRVSTRVSCLMADKDLFLPSHDCKVPENSPVSSRTAELVVSCP